MLKVLKFIGLWLFILCVAFLIIVSIIAQSEAQKDCENAGGTFMMDRYGHRVCLSPEMTIPLPKH